MITARLRHLHIAPRKVRLITDLIRGKTIEEAQAILDFTVKKAAYPLSKLLSAAAAGAKSNLQLDPANLYILKITVDEGPKLKRWRARARGSAYEIQKRTSHVNLVLDVLKTGKSDRKRSRRAEESISHQIPTEKKAPKLEKPKPKPATDVKKPVVSRVAKKIFRRQVF